jgi:thioredoxin reductase (NADPH)
MIAAPFPGEEEYLGRGVSYCATCDGMLYRKKKAVVYGLAADAPDEANYLAGIGVDIVYVCPGSRPAKLKEDISWLQGSISAIKGEKTVKSVELSIPSAPALEVNGVFLLRDAIAPGSLVGGLAMDGGYIAVDASQKTNYPGLFACGDCTGLPLQIAKAVGDGLVAGQEAAKYIGN